MKELLIVAVDPGPAEMENVTWTVCESADAALRWLLANQPDLMVIGIDAAEEMISGLSDGETQIPWYLVIPDRDWNPDLIRYWFSRGVRDVWKESTWSKELARVLGITTSVPESQTEKRSFFPTFLVQTKERLVVERRTQVVVCAGLHPRSGTTTMAVQMAAILSETGSVALLEHPRLERPIHEMWLGREQPNIILAPPNPLAYRFVVVDVGTHFFDDWAKEWLQQAGLILLSAECDALLLEVIFTQEVFLQQLQALVPYERQLHLVVARGVDGKGSVDLQPPFSFAGIHLGVPLTQKEVLDAYTQQKAPLDGKGGRKMRSLFEEFVQYLQPGSAKTRKFKWLM